MMNQDLVKRSKDALPIRAKKIGVRKPVACSNDEVKSKHLLSEQLSKKAHF